MFRDVFFNIPFNYRIIIDDRCDIMHIPANGGNGVNGDGALRIIGNRKLGDTLHPECGKLGDVFHDV